HCVRPLWGLGEEEIHGPRVHGRGQGDVYRRAGWEAGEGLPKGEPGRPRARAARHAEDAEGGLTMPQGKCAFCGTFVTSGGIAMGRHSVACTSCAPLAQKWLEKHQPAPEPSAAQE